MYQITINVGSDFSRNLGDIKFKNSSAEEFLNDHVIPALNQLHANQLDGNLFLDFSSVLLTRHSKAFAQRLFYVLFNTYNGNDQSLASLASLITIKAPKDLLLDYWFNKYHEEKCKSVYLNFIPQPVTYLICPEYIHQTKANTEVWGGDVRSSAGYNLVVES